MARRSARPAHRRRGVPLRIRFLGVRGSCPCAGHAYDRYGGNTSCAVVELPGEAPIILDLGSGVRPFGLELDAAPGGPPPRLTALLTHLHWDHLIGLPFFSTAQHEGVRLDIYGPRQQGATMHELVDRVVQPPFFPVGVKDLKGDIAFHETGDERFAVGSAKVLVREVPHVGTTLGFRVEAAGASVVYISDHQPPEDRRSIAAGVLELCDGADLLVHDSQYTEAEMVEKGTWGHSTPAYAVHVARECGVRSLALFHHDPAHADDEVDRILETARAEPGAARLDDVVAAFEGQVIDVGRA